MKTSIVIPSNRSDLRSIGNILQLSGLDPESFEVVVRDNSESELKKSLLSYLDPALFKCNFVKSCSAAENFTSALELASGDNVLFMGDDDQLFQEGLKKIKQIRDSGCYADCQVFTGDYLVLRNDAAFIYRYPEFNDAQAADRLSKFIELQANNYIFYSVFNRTFYLKIFDFFWDLPFRFSYSDRLMTLMMLCGTKVAHSNSLLYKYDESAWMTAVGGASKDRVFYAKEGVDPEIDVLHYLMQALEGALLLKSKLARDFASQNLDNSAEKWFEMNFDFFKLNERPVFSRGLTYEQSVDLKKRTISKTSINLYELLEEIANIIAISNKGGAERFFSYWLSTK